MAYNGPLPQVVNAGGSGANTLTGVLTGNGTSAFTASTITQHAILLGGASNAVGSLADVAVNQVVISGGVAADPSFSAFPQISGLGVGASAGSTAGITFDGTNFLNNYAVGTWTPTLDGAVSGTTTYTTQAGYYTRIGNLVTVFFNINITAATGTGNAQIGGLPFTIKNQTNGTVTGTLRFAAVGWAWPVGTTSLAIQGAPNATILTIFVSGTLSAGALMQMSNAGVIAVGTISYQI